jgi:hypothetical protein
MRGHLTSAFSDRYTSPGCASLSAQHPQPSKHVTLSSLDVAPAASLGQSVAALPAELLPSSREMSLSESMLDASTLPTKLVFPCSSPSSALLGSSRVSPAKLAPDVLSSDVAPAALPGPPIAALALLPSLQRRSPQSRDLCGPLLHRRCLLRRAPPRAARPRLILHRAAHCRACAPIFQSLRLVFLVVIRPRLFRSVVRFLRCPIACTLLHCALDTRVRCSSSSCARKGSSDFAGTGDMARVGARPSDE